MLEKVVSFPLTSLTLPPTLSHAPLYVAEIRVFANVETIISARLGAAESLLRAVTVTAAN